MPRRRCRLRHTTVAVAAAYVLIRCLSRVEYGTSSGLNDWADFPALLPQGPRLAELFLVLAFTSSGFLYLNTRPIDLLFLRTG